MNTYVIACRTEWFWDDWRKSRHPPGKWIEIREPAELDSLDLNRIQPRFLFFPHWSHKVPARIYSTFECVCFHATPLPTGRGGSPIQNMVVRGFEETELCALRMAEAFDAGPIYARVHVSLLGGGDEVYMRISRSVVDMIGKICRDEPSPEEQYGEPSHFKRRKPGESLVTDELNTIDKLFDFIRILDAEDYPRAFIDQGPWRLEFSRPCLRRGRIEANVTIRLRPESPDAQP